MRENIDPKPMGLHASTRIERVSDEELRLIIRRKSRIIMKDGKAILEKIVKITDCFPGSIVSVETTAPVCSKTKAFLKDQGVPIIKLD